MTRNKKKREQCGAVMSFPAEQKHFRAKDVRDEMPRHTHKWC